MYLVLEPIITTSGQILSQALVVYEGVRKMDGPIITRRYTLNTKTLQWKSQPNTNITTEAYSNHFWYDELGPAKEMVLNLHNTLPNKLTRKLSDIRYTFVNNYTPIPSKAIEAVIAEHPEQFI